MGFPAHPQPHSRASDKTVDDSVYSPQYPYAMGPHCWSWKLLKMDRRSPPSGSLRPLRSHSSCYNQRSHGQRLDADNASEVPLVWDNRSSCHCARAQSMALTGTPVSLQPGAVGEMSSQNMQYFIIHVIIELVDVPAFESGGQFAGRPPWNFRSESLNLRKYSLNFLFTACLFLSLKNRQYIHHLSAPGFATVCMAKHFIESPESQKPRTGWCHLYPTLDGSSGEEWRIFIP